MEPDKRELYDQSLDQEYAQCLQELRHLIPGLEEPIDIKKTAQWIERFNNTPPDEKALRNRCARLLLNQLLEDNLTHPFIFPHLLDEPLEVLLQNDPDLVGDGPFEPLQHLVKQFEVINARTHEDIRSLQVDTPPKQPSKPLHEPATDGLHYLVQLQDALRSALLFRVSEIIENPGVIVPVPPEHLHPDDRQWLTIVLEGIRAKVSQKQHTRPTRTVECQTINDQPAVERAAQSSSFIDRTEIERYLERKFAKLYANFRVREKALEIRTQTAGGIHLIDVSQRLVQQCRRSFPAADKTAATNRNRRRSDN
uniref:DUF4485 domain-containing protein n=1 Tax=Anopheles culicifacies TaxID=139723 RepID=A0A182MRF0_9DIPT